MPEPTEKQKFPKKSGITILIGCVAAKLMKKFTAGRVYCFSLKKQTWTDGGYSNYKNLLSDSKHHSKSVSHLGNYKSLKKFGKENIECSISNVARIA